MSHSLQLATSTRELSIVIEKNSVVHRTDEIRMISSRRISSECKTEEGNQSNREDDDSIGYQVPQTMVRVYAM
jgi:hypothetical protein